MSEYEKQKLLEYLYGSSFFVMVSGGFFVAWTVLGGRILLLLGMIWLVFGTLGLALTIRDLLENMNNNNNMPL